MLSDVLGQHGGSLGEQTPTAAQISLLEPSLLWLVLRCCAFQLQPCWWRSTRLYGCYWPSQNEDALPSVRECPRVVAVVYVECKSVSALKILWSSSVSLRKHGHRYLLTGKDKAASGCECETLVSTLYRLGRCKSRRLCVKGR